MSKHLDWLWANKDHAEQQVKMWTRKIKEFHRMNEEVKE